MNNAEILKPIRKKIYYWVEYEKNKPKSGLDEYRKQNDLDCQLTGGNLNADTIISLWLPLRFTLVRLNEYAELNKIADMKNKFVFLSEFIKLDLEKFLPINNPMVIKLSELFKLGMKRQNVMILPDESSRKINRQRGDKPYYDYVPHFLYECFQGGKFSKYFKSDDELVKWIEDEHLEMFFENEKINKLMIKDLSGSGSVKNNIPKNMETMLDNYICVLKERGKKLLNKEKSIG